MRVLIVALVVFFTLRLAKVRNVALAEAARSQQLQRFMLNLFGDNEKSAAPSNDLRAVTLLDLGAGQVDSLQNDPDTQAQLYEVLGRMYDMLGDYSKAGDLLGRALEKQKIAHGTDNNGFVDLLTIRGIVLADQSKFDEAERSLQEAFASAKRRLPADDPEMIYVEAALGRVAGASGSYQEAVTCFSRFSLVRLIPKKKKRPRGKVLLH